MRRRWIARDVQPLLDAVALAAGGAVLLGPDGERVCQAGDAASATRALTVRGGGEPGTLLVPAALSEGVGVVATAALERLAAGRTAIDDLAQVTRRLWWEQNLVFSSGGLLRHGFGERDIERWLFERLHAVRPHTVAVCLWDGATLEVTDGRPPTGVRIGDRLPATRVAAQVLEDGEPIAFTVGTEGVPPELGIAAVPGQPALIVPLRSAERVLGLVLLLRAAGEEAFGAAEVKLVQLLADLASVAIVNRTLVEEAEHSARLLRELELAAEIQQQLCPPHAATYGSLEVAARCRPVAKVGGDGFLHRQLADGTVLLGVVDLTGHGIAVALALAGLFARLDALADAVGSPARLLDLVNRQLTQGEFSCFTMATAAIAFVDPGSGRFTVATAAHPRPFIRRADGRVEVVEESGLPLGARAGECYSAIEGCLGPGDLLVMHTDGISEAVGESAAPFGVEGVRRALEGPVASAAEAVEVVLERATEFTAGTPAIDDQTILVARRVEASGG